MISIFKNWISSMLCIGIFITFIQLVIHRTNLKKYIYSLIGIVTVLTVVSPVINFFQNETVEDSVRAVLANIGDSGGQEVNSEDIQQKSEEMIKKQFIESLKKDVEDRLQEKNVSVNKINVLLSDEYDIQKIEVNIKKVNNMGATIDNVNEVVRYINSEYDIDYSKITVIEEG